MIKKIVIGGAAAALVVAGAASASTLGDINDPTLAAGGFDIKGVETVQGGAEVDFKVGVTNSAGQDGKNVYVSEMTISGLVDANGKFMQGNLKKGENSQFSHTYTPATEIKDGAVTFKFPETIPADQLTGAHLFVTD